MKSSTLQILNPEILRCVMLLLWIYSKICLQVPRVLQKLENGERALHAPVLHERQDHALK